MKLLANIFLVLHLICVATIVVLLLKQGGKANKVVPKGLTHAGLGALVAGIAMVGIRSSQHHSDPALYPAYNNGTVVAKLGVVIVLLYFAFKNAKAPTITRGTWTLLLGLTVINIGLASSLKH
jgi:uncharacterized membrane protein